MRRGEIKASGGRWQFLGSASLGSLLLLIAVCITSALPIAAQERILVEFGDGMKYLPNASDPGVGLSWTAAGFDDSAWPVGTYGVGFDIASEAEHLIQTAVPSGTLSVFTRASFELQNSATIGQLFVGVDYDDGVVAWINGIEVYRSPEMPPGQPAWDALPTTHESGNGFDPDYAPFVDISSLAIPALQNGTNVLAIGVWNAGAISSDLVLVPQLVADKAFSLVRGPYLQTGTESSVIVRWRTGAAENSRVVYGASPGALTSTADDPAATTEHSVTLQGLTADSKYYYAVGNSTDLLVGDDEQHFFVTAPSVGTPKPTRIWVLGDSGTADASARAVRDAYLARTGSQHTDLWLMLGDNAYPSGTDGEYQLALFDVYDETLRKSVLWPTLGNHDAGSANSATQSGPYYDIFSLPAFGEAGGLTSTTEAYYSFDYGNIHFVVLDSQGSDRSPPSPPGPPPGGTMLTWLRDDLGATNQDWIIAFWHHPPYSQGSHNSDNPNSFDPELVEMRENAVPILENHGVDLVLTGHSHSYERSFLIDGHYGTSDTFSIATHVVDGGDGRPSGSGAYHKSVLGPTPHEGAVYAVAGNSGIARPGLLNHPAMFVSLETLGSLILNIDGTHLDLECVDENGVVRDSFTMIKGECDPAEDLDLDTICDVADNCPNDPNVDQANSDGDGPGDACDNCPSDDNPGQEDTDADGIGDACDGCPDDPDNDRDGDGFCGDVDNCPGNSNPLQEDDDLDGIGNACDSCPDDPDNDIDNDSLCFGDDNCPTQANSSQSDVDADGTGDVCDPCPNDADDDIDSDGICGDVDNCPNTPNAAQLNADDDGLGDLCDICALDPDNDFDVDGDCGDVDNCPGTFNPDQADGDGDGFGDACDMPGDGDFDGVPDGVDNCQMTVNPVQRDEDLDGDGDACDDDDDGDGVLDTEDCAPLARGVSLLPGSIGPTLRLDKSSGTTLRWSRGAQGHVSNVYRGIADLSAPSLLFDLPTCFDTGNSGTESTDSDHPLTNELFFYFVSGVNICGEGSLGQDSLGTERSTVARCSLFNGDFDTDTVADLEDNCPRTSNPDLSDGDGDFVGDVCDGCPTDAAKIEPGACGCGIPDTDGDADGTHDCNDLCPADPGKIDPGVCGCAVQETDSDGDGTPDCNDLCPADPGKTAPGICGCAVQETDSDGDGTPDCNDLCPADPGKTAPGICGCGAPDSDSDNDGTLDCEDLAIFSAADQVLVIGDPPTQISPITIRDHAVTPSIKTTQDIRIRIPSNSNMKWDTAVDSVALAGNAANKVSTNLKNYQDGDRTLVLDVTADFAAGDQVTLSGPLFTDFSAPSSADRLELEINNDGNVSAEDERLHTIVPGANSSIVSAGNQVFPIAAAPAAISPITISDAAVPTITSVNDIRIHVPPSLAMSWDTGDVTATLGGGAAAKVSPTVSYENGGATLVLDVTGDFTAGDFVIVSGLSFAGFTAVSPASHLDLETGNDAMVTATDSKTIRIVRYGISSAADQVFVVDDPPTPISTITITDDAVTPTIKKTQDIRIRIPSSFDMGWDTNIQTVSIGGVAANKVSVNLKAYENGDRTLVLDVTSDFAAGDEITLAGAAFHDFGDPAAADNLELEVADNASIAGTDDKTITILDEPDDAASNGPSATVDSAGPAFGELRSVPRPPAPGASRPTRRKDPRGPP